MAHILIVEDEPQLARLLQLELQFEQFDTTIAYNGQQTLQLIQKQTFDLIILDINLPEIDGFTVLQKVRTFNQIPIILLTAKNDVIDKVKGLNFGANDYVTKPFAFEELLARIHVQLRSKSSALSNELSVQQITVNTASYVVQQHGELIDLTRREFDLLVHFMRHVNHVQNRDQLLNAVWGFDYYGDTNVVDVYVRYLRQKLGHAVIQTVRGVGYVMKEDE